MSDERDSEIRAERIRFQLELADALIWAAEHPDELLAIVRSAPTGADAIAALVAPPSSFGEAAAHHVLT